MAAMNPHALPCTTIGTATRGSSWSFTHLIVTEITRQSVIQQQMGFCDLWSDWVTFDLIDKVV